MVVIAVDAAAGPIGFPAETIATSPLSLRRAPLTVCPAHTTASNKNGKIVNDHRDRRILNEEINRESRLVVYIVFTFA
jgi:hypothetical protein